MSNNLRFMKAYEILVGDTIAFMAGHPENVNYIIVQDVEEGEYNFSHYDGNGRPVYFDLDNAYAAIMIKGKLMSHDGERDIKKISDTGYYPMHTDCIVLLIDRKA